jgi:heptosyltransferase II
MSAVAVVQMAFIGDVILATPLLEAARVSNPDDRVIAVVRAGCDNIIENNPFVDEIVVWDKHGSDKGIGGIRSIAVRLRDLQVHTALIPHRSLRTALAMKLSGVKERIGFAKGGGAMLHTMRVPYRTGLHEVERNLMLAKAAGWKSEGFKPSIFPEDEDFTVIENILHNTEKYCIIAPGSMWATKIWPADFYIRAGKVFAGRGMNVVLSGGTDDESLCRSIAESIPGAVNTCGLLTLRQSAALYCNSEFVLTGDTAPQHIAAAVGVPVFSIFGPTVRDFGFWPYSEHGYMIEENMDCRPCGVHGHRKCPKKNHACMRNITYTNVVEIIDRELGK